MPITRASSSIAIALVLIFMAAIPTFESAYSSVYSSQIGFDKIPTFVYAGEMVTFTGRVMSGTYSVSGVEVEIKEDDRVWFDETLALGRTDSNGEFSIPWKVSAGLIERDFEIYAVFEGDSEFVKARSYTQKMRVEKMSGSITLDPIPSTAKIGEAIIFSGTLRLASGNTEGAIVYIQDEDRGNPDDLLATAYVDRNGRFSANWFVSDTDPDNTIDIYAVYEGDSKNYRLTTCDSGPTRSFGGLCLDTIKLHISGYERPTLPTDDAREFMELYYSRSFTRSPHVAIVPSPDSYDTVRGHIIPVQEGIRMWKGELEQKFGGTWDVTFEIAQGQNFRYKPDVVINLVTDDEDQGCNDEYAGWAAVFRNGNPPNTINTHVCSTSDGARLPNSNVAATAAHEFIHAMGLGHTFNKAGDLMCSIEDNIPTCKYAGPRSKTPSNLNLDAVAKLYGTDGFRSPNNPIPYGEKFLQNDAYRPTTLEPAPTLEPKHISTGCTSGNYRYDENIDVVLKPYQYYWIEICAEVIKYSFSTRDPADGFKIHVLPPETDVANYVESGIGSYYTCEEPGSYWREKGNTCRIEPGSVVVLENDGHDTIEISGWAGTPKPVNYAADCPPNGYTYDHYENVFLEPQHYMRYSICNNHIQYSFSTIDSSEGFKIYVLPPNTDVEDFVYYGVGNHYLCEDIDESWHEKGNTCYIEPGSNVILFNDMSRSIEINGRLWTFN